MKALSWHVRATEETRVDGLCAPKQAARPRVDATVPLNTYLYVFSEKR